MISSEENTSQNNEKPPRHVAALLRKRPKPTKEVGLEKCIEYVGSLASQSCFDLQQRPIKCTCLYDNIKCAGGEAWEPFIGEYIYDFIQKSHKQRQQILFETTKVLISADKNFRLPVPAIGAPEGQQLFTVCNSSYCRLLNVGRKSFESLKLQAKLNVIKPSGMEGKKSNRKLDPVIRQALEKTFRELRAMSTSGSTRTVRMDVGMEVRDVEEELEELPSHWTARNIYRRFCGDLGYKVETINKNGVNNGNLRFIPMENFEGEQRKPCCLSTFQDYWSRNHPNLVIPNVVARRPTRSEACRRNSVNRLLRVENKRLEEENTQLKAQEIEHGSSEVARLKNKVLALEAELAKVKEENENLKQRAFHST